MLSIHDELAAWQLDKAVALFGTCVDSEIDKATRSAKNDKAAEVAANRVISKWVVDGKSARARYRQPVATR